MTPAGRNPGPAAAIRRIGGEGTEFRTRAALVRRIPADDARLVNMYGITETTVHVSYRELDSTRCRPTTPRTSGARWRRWEFGILDDRLRPVPLNVPGEMYVTGGQLTQGYLAAPDLSSTRFVADPFAGDGSRMYRTGDRARRVGNDIEVPRPRRRAGPMRGFRIEFGEIEAALLTASGVVGATVRIVDGPSGDTLVGYVVADGGRDVVADDVITAAARQLPAYMGAHAGAHRGSTAVDRQRQTGLTTPCPILSSGRTAKVWWHHRPPRSWRC